MAESKMKDININFQKLTPSKNIDLGVYEKSLDFVFSDADIKNIAISGSYGAGKSSLIETYKTESNQKFISISLAHFENETKMKQEVGSNNLEGKIINQLMHQIKATNIPLTRFKTKENPSKKKSFTYSIVLVLALILLIINIKYADWINLISKVRTETTWFWLSFFQSGSFQIFTLMFIAFSSIYMVYYFITVQKNKLTIKKAVAKDFEIEVFEETDSYFDKHLNEVLYLFDNSGANVIVFEDMDRFEDNHIFEKLREINTLINNRLAKNKTLELSLLIWMSIKLRNKLIRMEYYNNKGIDISDKINNITKKGKVCLKINNYINYRISKKTKIIRFMYLLRDDVFVSKERTKFFDYIIPVIPVVDSTNSYDKFISKFKEAGILEEFDQTFLYNISLYVDDYRILKNIHNEFISYHEKLEVKNYKLKYNNLLSMIIYKNIFPKDFADLQLNKGYVKSLFDNKKAIVKKEISTKNVEIQDINKEIQDINNMFLSNIDDLDATYLNLPKYIKINNVEMDSSYTPAEIINAIKENDYKVDIGKHFSSYYSSTVEIEYSSIDMQNEFNKLMTIDDYKRKYDLIKKHNSTELKLLDTRKQRIIQEISDIKNRSLYMCITRNNKKEVFDIQSIKTIEDKPIDEFDYIKRSDYYNLLVYLISNGYIEEKGYTDYMSYFYPNSISTNDKLFLRSIIDQVALEFEYHLDSPSKVVNRIDPSNFSEVEVLNFDLLSYLLFNNNEKEDNLSLFLSSIIQNCKNGIEPHKYIQFLIKYFNLMRNIDVLSEKILVEDSFINFIVSSSKINLIEKEKIVMFGLVFTDTIYSENVQEYISNSNYFISNKTVKLVHDSYISDVNSVSDKLIQTEEEKSIIDILCSRFNDNNIKFMSIEKDKISNQFLDMIYKNNYYIISLQHINLMLESFYNIAPSEDYQIKNYSLICSDKNQPLYRYINQKSNINAYLNIIIEEIDLKLHEEEQVLLDIINNVDVKESLKIAYIQKSETLINDLKDVDSHDLKTELLKNSIVNLSQENILDYYKYNCEEDENINNILINFINQQSKLLIIDFNWVSETESKEIRGKLLSGFIKCNDLENKHYNSLFTNTTWHFPSFSFAGINKDKMDILIATDTVKMNENTLKFMRENYSNNLKKYILTSPNKYTEIINEENFSYEELLWVLNSKEFEESSKLKLLKFTGEIIPYKSEYSDNVKKHILNNCFDNGELGYICDFYPNEKSEIKIIIESLIVEYIDEVINEKISLGFELLSNICMKHSLNKENKLLILDNSLINLECEEIKKLLTIFKEENYYLILDNKRPLILKSNVNKSILEKLKKKKIISSFNVDSKEDDYYRVYPYKKLWDKLNWKE